MAHCTVINLPDLLAINLTRNSEKVNETRQMSYIQQFFIKKKYLFDTFFQWLPKTNTNAKKK